MTYDSEEVVNNKFRELTAPQYVGLNLHNLFNAGYASKETVIIESAQGPYMIDVSGNQYLDIGMSAGSMIFGHAYQPVLKKITTQATKGSIFIQPTKSAYLLKEKMLENLPDEFGGVIFCNSGSEATMRAIRLARSSSGKNKIAMFSGGWHGSHDAVLVGDDYDSSENCPKPKSLSTGIPRYLLDDILMLPYNKLEAFHLIQQEAHQLALVIIEPVQGSNPRSDIAPFLRELRATCSKNGVLLAFDEIITGFRLSLGGAVNSFGIKPDIITYGKILGGGLPIGAVVFKHVISSRVFGDQSDSFFTGGTFSANPLTMEAGIEVLRNLKQSDYQYIDKLSKEMRGSCNQFFIKTKIPMQFVGCNSINRILFTDKKIGNRRARDFYESPSSVQIIFKKLMILNGVFQPSNGIIFLSFAHNTKHVARIITSIKNTALNMRHIGCFH